MASGDFVLQKYDGTTATVDTTDATTYSEAGSSISTPGVYEGENVAVTLDSTASSPTATNVVVFPEELGGRVATVAGPTVMLTDKRGTDTVIVSPSTKYYQKGADPTGVSDGEMVTVFGLPDAGTPGELDAQVLAIFNPATPPQPQIRLPQSRRTPAAEPRRPRPLSRREGMWGILRASWPFRGPRPTARASADGRPRTGSRSTLRPGAPALPGHPDPKARTAPMASMVKASAMGNAPR